MVATRGEVGSRGPYEELSDDELGSIRTRELESVAKHLGIKRVTHMGYKDGTLPDVAIGELEDKLIRAMINLTPTIVITFEPGGISNHPDHIRLTRATTYAFQKYVASITEVTRKTISDENRPRHPRDAWQIAFSKTIRDSPMPKLYYACLPKSVLVHLVKSKVFPEESLGQPWSTIEDKHITTVIDIRQYKKKKEDALRLHRTQQEDVKRFLSIRSNPWVTKEFFVLRMHGAYEVFMGKNDRVSNRL